MNNKFEIMRKLEEGKRNIALDAYLKNIKTNGLLLKYIPEEDRTYEICKQAILQNRKAYEYVPNKLKTYTLWLLSKTPRFLWHN